MSENTGPEKPAVDGPGSLRVRPSDWLSCLDLAAVFGRPPQALAVDLGCGKGRFLLARAAAFPAISFLGIDRLGSRLLKVERKARRRGLHNLRLFYVEAYYAVRYLIPAGSVADYYVFFPDPWPKRRHHRRRLFDAEFLDALQRTLKPGGAVHIATDHLNNFQAIHQALARDSRFSEIPPFVPGPGERTDFERIFLSQQVPIGRCSFRKNA